MPLVELRKAPPGLFLFKSRVGKRRVRAWRGVGWLDLGRVSW